MEPLWSPVVATGGNWSQIALPPKPQKQAKTVAVGCDWLPREVMVSRASAVGCHPLREVPSLRRRGSTSTALEDAYLLLLQSGHGHWSQPQPVHASRIMQRLYRGQNLNIASNQLMRAGPLSLQ